MKKNIVKWGMLAIILTFGMTVVGCVTTYVRKIPKNLQKTYSETVTVPNMPVEEMFLKIHLFFIQGIANYHFKSSITENGKTVWRFDNITHPANEDRLEVSIEIGKYRLDYTPISILSDSKDFKKNISGKEEYFQTLAKGLKSWFFSEPYTSTQIDTFLKNGDTLYKQGKYDEARKNFFSVAMEDPYNETALAFFANCWMQIAEARPVPAPQVLEAFEIWNFEREISYYNKAIAVSSLMPEQQSMVQITQLGRQRVQQLHQLELQRVQEHRAELQQQQQENFNNLAASLNSLSASLAQVQQNQSQGGNTGGGTGGSSGGQSVSSGGSSSSGRGGNANEASMRNNYNRRAKAAQDAYFQLQKDPTNSRLIDALKSQQRSLKSYREECKRKGVDIQASMYETAWP